MATITKPIILDETGQDIVTKLDLIANNIVKKPEEIGKVTATTNETLASVIDRLRDTYFNDYTQYCQLKMDIDGTSNMLFRCVRWSSTNVSIWESSKPTSDSSMTILSISMSSSAVNVRKYVTSSSGVTGSNISSNVASGDFSILGIKYS